MVRQFSTWLEQGHKDSLGDGPCRVPGCDGDCGIDRITITSRSVHVESEAACARGARVSKQRRAGDVLPLLEMAGGLKSGVQRTLADPEPEPSTSNVLRLERRRLDTDTDPFAGGAA